MTTYIAARIVTRMRRVLCGVFLIYQALFLNAFVPGHTRGVVQLPGSHAVASCCCCGAADQTDSKKSPSDKPTDKEKQNRAENCAICAFAARMTVPPAIDLTLPPLERIGIIRQLAPQRFEIAAFPLRYHGRAPPALHV